MNSFETLDSSDINEFKGKSEFTESEVSGKRFAMMSLSGRKFTLVNIEGDPTTLVSTLTDPKTKKQVEIPMDEIDAYIVGASPKISRSFYELAYTPGKKSAPDCYSNDGVMPSSRILKPKSTTCQNCEKAAKGSKVSDGMDLIACSIKKKLVVVVNKDDTYDFDNPYLLILSSGSKMNFDEYLRSKSKSKFSDVPLPFFKTKITMLPTDKEGNSITYSRLGFSPVCIEKDENIRKEINKFGNSGEKFAIVQSMLGLDEAPRQIQSVSHVVEESAEVHSLPAAKPKQKASVDADIADFTTDDIPF